jgi:uncharacterized membrane protein
MKTIVFIHVFSGAIALAAGLLAAIGKKGLKLHIWSGRVFAAAMILCSVAGLVASFVRGNGFLLGISFFSLYLVVSGWLFGKVRSTARLKKIIRPTAFLGVLSAGYMFYTGFTGGLQGTIILSVFAGILTLFAATDMLGPVKPQTRITRHGGRMGGAYIAAVTAFLVVNFTIEPMWVLWLMPTVIGTIIITKALFTWNKAHSR